jgi:hypothetical protein
VVVHLQVAADDPALPRSRPALAAR